MPIHTIDLSITNGVGCIVTSQTFNGFKVGYYTDLLFEGSYMEIDTVNFIEHAKLIASVYGERYKIPVFDLTKPARERVLSHEQYSALGFPVKFNSEYISNEWIAEDYYVELQYDSIVEGETKTRRTMYVTCAGSNSGIDDLRELSRIYLDIAELSKDNLHMIMRIETKFGILRYEPDFEGNWRVFEYGSVMA